MENCVLIFSGGVDSLCMTAKLISKYRLHAISFMYGQRANKEIEAAKKFSKILNFKHHKIINISFMKELYGKSNVLTDSKQKIPQKFNYSIVVPLRNAVFLSIASAWAFTLDASLVAYGAHTGDKNYPDCRPAFSKKLESAFNEAEKDGIRSKVRQKIQIWSPYSNGISKSELLKEGYEKFGDLIFQTWSCYSEKKIQCGVCESCNNRKKAFAEAGIKDKTKYARVI